MAEEEIAAWVVGTLSTIMAILGLFLWARSVDLGMGVFGFGLLVFGLGMDFWLLKRHYDLRESAADRED
ncbi:MAG: hypothetical protein KIT36_21710 [Alphaproteobacteria bacterium]|nr:hypothetical protein [Alphaproteobacteria bacterium]